MVNLCPRFDTNTDFPTLDQYARNVQLDDDGYVTDDATCDAFDEHGKDNGKLTVIEDSLEWHNLFVGQYTLGDIQFKNFININSMVGLYWKVRHQISDVAQRRDVLHLFLVRVNSKTKVTAGLKS